MTPQEKQVSVIVGVAVAIVALLLLANPFFILNEGDQAVLVRFGAIVDTQTEAGLHFKLPAVDTVVTFPKRILSWDGDPRSMLTAEKQSIWVDTTARWKISDAKLFYASVGSLVSADSRIKDVIESAVRTIIAENSLSAAVRNSNAINETKLNAGSVVTESGQEEASEVYQELLSLIETTEKYPTLNAKEGRRKLSQNMLVAAKPALSVLGIEVVDIIVRQIRYTDEVTESVYNRMISERNRIAQAYRSVGEGRKNEILGQMENELKTILSEAYRDSEKLKGEADAKAAAVYTSAYQRDPEFFKFWRAMESYRKTIGSFSKTLSTDMDYFKYLYSINGR